MVTSGLGAVDAAQAARSLDTGAVDAAHFARSVATTPDAELAAGMRGELRGQILDEIFRRMEEHFRATAPSCSCAGG